MIQKELAENGYCMMRDAIPDATLIECRNEIEEIIKQNDFRGGFRRATEHSKILKAATELPQIHSLLSALGYPDAKLVRSIVFDKTPGANWKVAWHQDTKIAVQKKVDTPGYSGWSIKDNVIHVQPPASIMETMITLRIHLDDAAQEQGALRVVPKSHSLGFLDPESIKNLSMNEMVCECAAGDILVMHPLILHASSPALKPLHRRVLHLEYATAQLDPPLQWRVSA